MSELAGSLCLALVLVGGARSFIDTPPHSFDKTNSSHGSLAVLWGRHAHRFAFSSAGACAGVCAGGLVDGDKLLPQYHNTTHC